MGGFFAVICIGSAHMDGFLQLFAYGVHIWEVFCSYLHRECTHGRFFCSYLHMECTQCQTWEGFLQLFAKGVHK